MIGCAGSGSINALFNEGKLAEQKVCCMEEVLGRAGRLWGAVAWDARARDVESIFFVASYLLLNYALYGCWSIN